MLLSLDCSTIEPEQAEELLFSTEHKDKNILIKAHKSSLIINNIHLLNKSAQKKLLQALESKSLIFDGDKDVLIDVRIIICTEVSLDKYVASLQLREDLFFRLDVLQITVPTIEQRTDDFAELLDNYKQLTAPEKLLTKSAIRKLESYKYPYNYRELEKILIKANSTCEQENIDVNDLDFSHSESVHTATQAQSETKLSSRGELSLDEFVAEIEKQEIRSALNQTRWNRTEAAKLLGISFRTIRYKIKKLEIE